MKLRTKVKGLNGRICVPGDKSIVTVIMFGSLAKVLQGYDILRGEMSFYDAGLRDLGVKIWMMERLSRSMVLGLMVQGATHKLDMGPTLSA